MNILLAIVLCCKILFIAGTCKWQKRPVQPEVSFINLQKSVSRRQHMENFLLKYSYVFHRSEAVQPRDIFTPEDIKDTWSTAACLSETSWKPPTAGDTDPDKQWILKSHPKKLYIKGLCGSHTNSWKELATVASHLLAIRQAVYSSTATSRFALILEDDVWSPFDVDFEELADSVNEEFGILQLFNSKPVALFEFFDKYRKDPSALWRPRPPAFDGRYLPTWSTGAYLIDRILMKSVIDAIVEVNNDGWTSFTILAGSTHPVCKPSICCMPNSTRFIEPTKPPCTYAPVGLQADSLLYSTATTFTLTLPIFLSNSQSQNSTLHQSHVASYHKSAFARIGAYVSQLYSGEVPLPTFVRKSCNSSDSF